MRVAGAEPGPLVSFAYDGPVAVDDRPRVVCGIRWLPATCDVVGVDCEGAAPAVAKGSGVGMVLAVAGARVGGVVPGVDVPTPLDVVEPMLDVVELD